MQHVFYTCTNKHSIHIQRIKHVYETHVCSCVLFSSLYKNIGYINEGHMGASFLTIHNPKEFYRIGTAHPGFEIPGSATVHSCFILLLIMYKSVISSLFDSTMCSGEFNLSKFLMCSGEFNLSKFFLQDNLYSLRMSINKFFSI